MYTAAPVFEPEFNARPAKGQYPGLYITVPVYGNDSLYLGRNRVAYYPMANPASSAYATPLEGDDAPEDDCSQDNPDPDPEGWQALSFGGDYYDEGMACEDKSRRIDCFRAAELLYLHSSYRGNPYADLCLGYIYSYDRCQGNYLLTWWSPSGTYDDVYEHPEAFPADEEACKRFKAAAEAGIAEACYKYGDMLKAGRGCTADASLAYQQFVRAYDLGRHDRARIWGSAALRLATCFEEGAGVRQSLRQALSWYEKAETGLSAAIREGDTWYRGALAHSKSGVVRMRQEISGQY